MTRAGIEPTAAAPSQPTRPVSQKKREEFWCQCVRLLSLMIMMKRLGVSGSDPDRLYTRLTFIAGYTTTCCACNVQVPAVVQKMAFLMQFIQTSLPAHCLDPYATVFIVCFESCKVVLSSNRPQKSLYPQPVFQTWHMLPSRPWHKSKLFFDQEPKLNNYLHNRSGQRLIPANSSQVGLHISPFSKMKTEVKTVSQINRKAC